MIIDAIDIVLKRFFGLCAMNKNTRIIAIDTKQLLVPANTIEINPIIIKIIEYTISRKLVFPP